MGASEWAGGKLTPGHRQVSGREWPLGRSRGGPRGGRDEAQTREDVHRPRACWEQATGQ